MNFFNRFPSDVMHARSISFVRLVVCAAAWLLAMAESALSAEALLANAVEKNDPARAASLLEKKSDVNVPQADGMTALHWAVLHDDVDVVKQLLAAGADSKAANRYGVTPLELACTNGRAAVVQMLLDAGADPNHELAGGATALMIAARTGRPEPVKALLARGAKVNAREHRQQTALMWAAAEGHADVVDLLLKAAADYRTPLKSGFTPFFFAVREGRYDVVQTLIRAGADVNEIMRPERSDKPATNETTALLLAVENGHFELASALLKAGARPNDRPKGYTALHAITWVRKPIRGDGDPPPVGSGTMSSLEIVRQFVAHGADVNARLEKGVSKRGHFTTTGSTPFLLAARASDVPLMKLLLELGADPKLGNADDCVPLLAAAGVGALEDGEETAGAEDESIEAVRLLLKIGADANAVDKNGETALHGAAYQSRSKLARLIVESGSDINVWNQKNKAGWTPLMIAHGHRPHNFRPDPETISAIEDAMRRAGVTPTNDLPDNSRQSY
jgi:ankyrin repeat protein